MSELLERKREVEARQDKSQPKPLQNSIECLPLFLFVMLVMLATMTMNSSTGTATCDGTGLHQAILTDPYPESVGATVKAEGNIEVTAKVRKDDGIIESLVESPVMVLEYVDCEIILIYLLLNMKNEELLSLEAPVQTFIIQSMLTQTITSFLIVSLLMLDVNEEPRAGCFCSGS